MTEESEGGEAESKGCCLAQLGCCFCGMACRLCCHRCPPVYESTSTRMMYVLFLFFGVAIMSTMMSSFISNYLNDNFEELSWWCELVNAGKDCEFLNGYLAVYRIGMAFTVFYIFGALFTINVRGSKSCRGKVHNGAWLWKFLFLCGLCAGAFLIPLHVVEYVLRGWAIAAMVGAAGFIVIQSLVLAQFAHSLTDSWLKAIRNGKSACGYNSLMGFLGVLLNLLFGCGILLLFNYYSSWEGCTLNKIWISISAGLCLLAEAFSVQPCMSTRTGSVAAGFMQSSLLSAYVTYLTWNALQSVPVAPETSVVLESLNGSNYTNAMLSEPDGEVCYPKYWFLTNQQGGSLLSTYVSLAIMFITVMYFSMGFASNAAHALGVQIPSPTAISVLKLWKYCCPTGKKRGPPEDKGGQVVHRNEMYGSTYSYACYHFILCLATCYLVMQLTNWFRPEQADITQFSSSMITAWVKIIFSWLCSVVYLCSLIMPECCPGELDRRNMMRRISAGDDQQQRTPAREQERSPSREQERTREEESMI